MKALVYTGGKNLIYQDYSDPIKNKDEEIIKINSVGICGSDMHAFLGHDERRPSPLILGHEPSGIIVGGENDGKKVAFSSGFRSRKIRESKANSALQKPFSFFLLKLFFTFFLTSRGCIRSLQFQRQMIQRNFLSSFFLLKPNQFP